MPDSRCLVIVCKKLLNYELYRLSSSFNYNLRYRHGPGRNLQLLWSNFSPILKHACFLGRAFRQRIVLDPYEFFDWMDEQK